MVVGESSINNIIAGMETTDGVRLHNHKRKLKQRFDIIRKLGQGTYGKVQLGINKETGEEVAIKTIKKCKIETEADLIRIRREIQIMSSVRHPNIIHIFEVFENKEKMVLVMEFAAGGELYDYLSKQKVLTEHEARRIFRQIATAVFYCHKHKICHRDLKLENILLDENNNAKIADFGLSNVFDEKHLLSTFCGSPLYASPEIVKGMPYCGPEVDCWSLGVLLYTLVYGAMPFDGSDFKRLVKQITQSDYFEPRKFSSASPLIKEMLTVDSPQRATIEKICIHWWVNDGYEQNCLDVAEDLAAQTPVRLDLLLSLVPKSAHPEKLVINNDEHFVPGEASQNSPQEVLKPTRCYSTGSIVELGQSKNEETLNKELLEAKAKKEKERSPIKTPVTEIKTSEILNNQAVVETNNLPKVEKVASPEKKTEEKVVAAPKSPVKEEVAATKVPTDEAKVVKEEKDSKSPTKPKADATKKVKKIVTKTSTVPKKVVKKSTADTNNDENNVEKTVSLKPKSKESATNTGTAEKSNEKDTGTDDTKKKVKTTRIVRKVPTQKVSPPPTDTVPTKKVYSRTISLDSALKSDEPTRKSPTQYNRTKSINVGGAKLLFEKKAASPTKTSPPKSVSPSKSVSPLKSVSPPKSTSPPKSISPPLKNLTTKVATTTPSVDVKKESREEEKKRAVDIIKEALGKPPTQRKYSVGSCLISAKPKELRQTESETFVNRNHVESKFKVDLPIKSSFDLIPKSSSRILMKGPESDENISDSSSPDKKRCSKLEITLKSATLPRPRKTSKAQIILSGPKSPEIERPDVLLPERKITRNTGFSSPISTRPISPIYRSSSLESKSPTTHIPIREHIIPIHIEPHSPKSTFNSITAPPKKPLESEFYLLQRNNPKTTTTTHSKADSNISTSRSLPRGTESIRKSPKEYIIPIVIESGDSIASARENTPSASGSSQSIQLGSNDNCTRSRLGSVISDASEDEVMFPSLHRNSEDLLQKHMHRLRSSRPLRQVSEYADSISSGEDDDDDGFELLTAENLFSTLLNRVRCLTQRLNDRESLTNNFPSSQLLKRFNLHPSNSCQRMWTTNELLRPSSIHSRKFDK